MYESHASYSACGLGSDGTDRLVQLVREAGPAAGLYGAKITGGGSGGTVAVLAAPGRRAAIDEHRAPLRSRRPAAPRRCSPAPRRARAPTAPQLHAPVRPPRYSSPRHHSAKRRMPSSIDTFGA